MCCGPGACTLGGNDDGPVRSIGAATPVTLLRHPSDTEQGPPAKAAPPQILPDGAGDQTRPMSAAPPPPSRRHRRMAKRRLVREQVVVVLVLLALLAVTVLLLCFEWLASGPVSVNAPPLLNLLGGTT